MHFIHLYNKYSTCIGILQSYWDDMGSWMCYKCYFAKFTTETIMFGKQDKNSYVIHVTIVIGKFHLYNQRLSEKQPPLSKNIENYNI